MKIAVTAAVLLLAAQGLAADPMLSLRLAHLREARAGESWEVRIYASNNGAQTALGALLSVALPPGAQVTAIPPIGWRCGQQGDTYVCDASTFAHTTVTHELLVQLSDDRNGANLELPVTLSASNAQPAHETLSLIVPRIITVTSTADAGAGSLREALLQANALCGPTKACDVLFDLATGSTFEPLTPLPAITACGRLFINGGTASGEPPYELSGAHIETDGKSYGLAYRPVCVAPAHLRVSGLAINRFADDGITIMPFNTQYYENTGYYSDVRLEGLFIGTDRTGREARPNGWRGITVHSGSTLLHVTGSVLSGNGRSGLYISSAIAADVFRTRIGADPQGQPLGNGAAGIFLHRGHLTVAENEIAFNNDFGIALARGTATASLQNANSIHHNEFVGVDWGLDGPTRDSGEAAGIPNAPKITSATYDAASNRTIVRGTIEIGSILGERYDIRIFVNHQPNERGEYEGEVPVTSSGVHFYPERGAAVYEWEIHHLGDLSGTIITASAAVAPYADYPSRVTSEFSNPVSLR